jgi:RHS repeat-associated protein
MGTNAYGYAYDAIGNRLAVNNNAEALSYTANALNQYTNILRVSAPPREDRPRFDLDGNLTNDNAWAYAWDGENRLTGASDGSVTATYAYDYMSRRCQKIVGSTTNTFQYDGWNLVHEVSVSGGNASTNVYSWGPDLSGSLQGAGGIGGLVSVTCDGATYYPCYDANGNITDYLNTNGTVVAHREYDAFGNTIVATGALVHELHFWFSTKYLDEETGLYYYGYRYYSSELGRWMNRDTIGEGGGWNLYSFVRNRPTSETDRLGLYSGSDYPFSDPIYESVSWATLIGRYGIWNAHAVMDSTREFNVEGKADGTCCCAFTIKRMYWQAKIVYWGDLAVVQPHELAHFGHYKAVAEKFRQAQPNGATKCCFQAQQTDADCQNWASLVGMYLRDSLQGYQRTVGLAFDGLSPSGATMDVYNIVMAQVTSMVINPWRCRDVFGTLCPE